MIDRIYRRSLLQNSSLAWLEGSNDSGLTPGGFESSREAAAAGSRGRKPMENGTQESSRVGGGSSHPSHKTLARGILQKARRIDVALFNRKSPLSSKGIPEEVP